MSGEPRSDNVRRSERRTLESIYREYYTFVWRCLARFAVPSTALDDAVHDTFIVVARRLDEFEGRASLRTWLSAIALRVAQAQRRDRARAYRNEVHLRHAGPEDDAFEPHAQCDAARELDGLMAGLEASQRAVFVMAELEGMTAPEIARALGVKLATVYSRLRLAREKVQTAKRASSRPSFA